MAPVASTQPARTVLSSTTVTAPSTFPHVPELEARLGSETGPTKWFAHRVGKYQTALAQRVGLAVLLDDLN
jgi:hypothetical protein